MTQVRPTSAQARAATFVTVNAIQISRPAIASPAWLSGTTGKTPRLRISRLRWSRVSQPASKYAPANAAASQAASAEKRRATSPDEVGAAPATLTGTGGRTGRTRLARYRLFATASRREIALG